MHNIILYQIYLPKNHHFKIHDDKPIIILCINVCEMLKINMFNINVRTDFLSEL